MQRVELNFPFLKKNLADGCKLNLNQNINIKQMQY